MICGCEHDRKDKTCIEIVPIFNTLTYDEMMEVARITIARRYKKGEMVYMTGDKGERLFVIHKGKVKISRLSHMGKEQVIRILGPGDFMGELSLFVHEPLTDNAEVLEDTTVCVIDGEKLKTLMGKYPTIAFKVMEELSSRLTRAENLIEHLGIHDVETRIVEMLLDLANDEGEVLLNMSKRDLASHIGMSQETLSRKLSYFQDMGWIKLKGHRRIIILDEDELRTLI
ncbi:Crp/Fnr family transcriptional regulator [Schnuerera sp.]|uniref:Crp/Fnr family transcriptional regulator n=1 Tax=Schnuerera sp. TaxID=2794844 RepID=UPI002CF7F2BB|nr:Crp/Fnr family transcriptional regulator [Schnuerera sp.]HSH36270.1 Crp/Fnr family transcriptional regulator [Schnuerera sp.]